MNSLYSCALVAVLSLAGAGPALAHADLASADPAAGATVKTAPTEISITFTEEVEPKFSSIQVLDAGGTRVDEGASHTAPGNEKLLSIGLKPLAAGTYKVIWHATAADDSHKTKGNYVFTVKP
jgi:methionine-rich copper-binding protein CopC